MQPARRSGNERGECGQGLRPQSGVVAFTLRYSPHFMSVTLMNGMPRSPGGGFGGTHGGGGFGGGGMHFGGMPGSGMHFGGGGFGSPQFSTY
jgi:hypothetical protein